MNVIKVNDCDECLVEGSIEKIDLLSRELWVRVDGKLVEFALLSDCAVIVNQQLVKLRLLQANDHVAVAYSVVAGVRCAHGVEVTWPRWRASIVHPDAASTT